MKIMYIRKVLGYDRYIEEKWKDKPLTLKAMKNKLDILHKQSKVYTDLNEWLALSMPLEEKMVDSNSKCVRMMTYHASKGLEFDLVILPDIVAGVVPSKKAKSEDEIEEERRMFYVAMTRAKKRLVICTLENKKTDVKPSVFLEKLL